MNTVFSLGMPEDIDEEEFSETRDEAMEGLEDEEIGVASKGVVASRRVSRKEARG